MQQEPAPARSLEPKQDSALPRTPTMPPPESLSEDHQPSHGRSLAEVQLDLGRWGLGLSICCGRERGEKGEGTWPSTQKKDQIP